MACARHVHGMCMACAWHVHGMCMACAWHGLPRRAARSAGVGPRGKPGRGTVGSTQGACEESSRGVPSECRGPAGASGETGRQRCMRRREARRWRREPSCGRGRSGAARGRNRGRSRSTGRGCQSLVTSVTGSPAQPSPAQLHSSPYRPAAAAVDVVEAGLGLVGRALVLAWAHEGVRRVEHGGDGEDLVGAVELSRARLTCVSSRPRPAWDPRLPGSNLRPANRTCRWISRRASRRASRPCLEAYDPQGWWHTCGE